MFLSSDCCYSEENKLQQNIAYICNCEYQYFLNKRNVVGVALGYKIKNSFYTNELCVQVLVSKKLPKDQLNSTDMIPLMYKGIPTDVKETGYFTACSLKKKIRPVLGGYSISTNIHEKNAGSVGCLVTNGVRNFLLSTNHTLVNLNIARTGWPILQPAHKYDGYNLDNTIGTLYKYIPLRFIREPLQPTNLTDCAIASLSSPDILSDKIALIGKVNCVKNAQLNEHVQKVGATTELTEGTVTNKNGTCTVTYFNGETALFKDQIFTTRMGDDGDSGSILVNSNKCAIGILFSIGRNAAAFNRFSTVLDQLDVYLPE